MAARKVLGVDKTRRTLLTAEERITTEARQEVYPVAIQIASAIRSGVPKKPLTNMAGGAIRAHVSKTFGDKGDEHRLQTVKMTGNRGAVMADMGMVPRKSETFVPNLMAKYGAASRWVWPIAMCFVGQIESKVIVGVRKAEVRINRDLSKV